MPTDALDDKELIPGQPIEYIEEYKNDTTQFILDILEKEFGFTGVERPDIHDIQNVYQRDGGNFWITLADGKVVGTIALKNFGNGRGYLKRMYVDKNLRGSGIAQQLLSALLQFAREKGYKEIYLGTNEKMTRAIKFYEREGFQRMPSLPADMPDFGDTIFFKMELK